MKHDGRDRKSIKVLLLWWGIINHWHFQVYTSLFSLFTDFNRTEELFYNLYHTDVHGPVWIPNSLNNKWSGELRGGMQPRSCMTLGLLNQYRCCQVEETTKKSDLTCPPNGLWCFGHCNAGVLGRKYFYFLKLNHYRLKSNTSFYNQNSWLNSNLIQKAIFWCETNFSQSQKNHVISLFVQ